MIGLGNARDHRLTEPRRVELKIRDGPDLVGEVRGAAVPGPHVADLHGAGRRWAHRRKTHPLRFFGERRDRGREWCEPGIWRVAR